MAIHHSLVKPQQSVVVEVVTQALMVPHLVVQVAAGAAPVPLVLLVHRAKVMQAVRRQVQVQMHLVVAGVAPAVLEHLASVLHTAVPEHQTLLLGLL